MGRENDALLPIHVEKLDEEGTNEYVVKFGSDGSLGQVSAKSSPGIGQDVQIVSCVRGLFLADDIPDEDLHFEASQNINALKQFYEQQAVTSVTIVARAARCTTSQETGN